MPRDVRSLLVVAVLLAPAVALPQVAVKPAVLGGFSDVADDPATGSASGRFGWGLGGSLLMGKKLYLEAGAFYARKSTEITATSGSNTIDFDGVSGIRLPVKIGYHLLGQERGAFGFRVFGGGSSFIVTSVDAVGLSTSDFESPSWAITAGAGLDFLYLFADLEYEWSLTDVTDSSTVDVGNSRSFFLTAGVKIPL